MTKMISFVRSLCVTAIVSLLAQSVWAATPVAVWDGFSNLTPAEGYTIVAGDGVVGSDGVATIAAGKTLKLTKDMGTQFTVVMEVSDIPGAAGSNFATLLDAFFSNGAAHLSLDTQEGKLMQKWSHNGTDYGTALKATPISGRNVIVYAYNRNWEKTYINGAEILSGTAGSSVSINRFCIGGYWGDTPTCTANGMKVYRVALYSTALSADEVAEIKCSRSAAAGEKYICSNLDRAETKSSHYTQSANVNFMLPVTGDYPAGTVVNVTTIKLGSPAGKSMANTVTLAGQTGTKGAAETSTTTGYTYVQPYTFSPAVEIEVGKTYTFNAGGSQCTGINGFSAISGNNMASYNIYSSVEGTVKSIIRKGTISGDCTIATATWANGTPIDGDLVELNVTNDATLTLDSTVSYSYLKITGDGALTISDLTKLGSTPIVGDGTIVIDKNGATVTGGQNDGTCDWNITGLTDAAKWTGTVWLKNVVWKNMNPATLGNENSTVRMTGVSGYSYNSNNATAGFAGTLDLVDEDTKVACTIDNAFNSTYFFGKLTGTGTFKTTGGQASSARYAFKDASAFEGTINLAGNNKSVTIGNDIPGVGDYFAGNVIGIRPTGTATVKAGKTWSATTITVNGKLSVENTGAISGAVTGVGTLSVPAFTTVNNNTIKTALQNQNNWKGTLQILGCNSISTDALSGTASALNNYGNVNSKIEFKDCEGTSGNGNYFGTTTAALNPEIVVTGTLKLTNGFSYDGSHTGSYTIFRKLSGSGEIVDGNTAGQIFYAKDVSDFTGSITMSAKKFVIGDHANSDTSVAGGAIIVREGYAARVDGTWSGSSVTVEGGIYGTGTVSSPLTYATTATLEPERGVVTAGAAVTFGSSIKVKVSAAPEEEGTKVLANTSVSESLVSTVVTTVIGATESLEYSLFQKQDGIYLMKVTTLEWQGASDSAIDAAGNWKGGEFNDNLTYGLFTFPACAETTIVRVPNGTADVSHISVVSGGKYKFVGEGQPWKIGALIASGATVEFENIKVDIDVSDISDYAAMKALVGANSNVAMPYAAITLDAGQTLNLYAGLTLKLPIVPTLNNEATIVVENAANVAWGTNYELLSWKTCKARFTYGRPTLSGEFTTPEGAGDARLLTAAKVVWLQLRSAKQMARKPIIVWPFGDSITEGMNAPNTRANYRIQLMQKLSLAGYNVKSVGFHDRNGPGNFGTIDPSGNRITDEEWEFHSGVGGELAVRYTGNHGTLHNSWENNLDVVGDPDVVLIHIGINDIVNGSDAQTTQAGYTLDEVKRLAKNILRERPNIKVVLSSMNRLRYGQTFQGAVTPDATSGNGNRYYVKPFHDAIKAFYEEVKAGAYPEDYPADRVFFADMYENIRPQGYATLQPDEDGQPGLFIEGGGDNIHPDWAGHEIMAQTWFDQIVQAIPLDEKGDYDCNLNHESPVAVSDDELGAKKNVPDEYLKGFKQAKVMKLEGNERYTDGVTYASEPISDNNTVVEKIGYYVEYVVPSVTTNIHRWVWVDMDAFGANKTLGEMLLQTSGDTRKVVSNLHIASNHLAIEPVAANTDGVSGMVEFYPNKPNGGGNVSGAPTHWMDTSSWNDGLASTMYGSFQVHRTAPNDVPYAGNARPAQVLFAYNGWMADDEKPNEFGIGNFSQHWNGCTMDWINMRESKTMNATCFQAKSIEVWVKLSEVSIEIPAAPMGATVEVTVGGETVDASSGSIIVTPGATIAVTYSAADDYTMADVVFSFVAGEESTIDISQVVPVAKVYVAQIGTDGKKYETLQAAIDAAKDGDTVYLIADTSETVDFEDENISITLHINEGVTLTNGNDPETEWYTVYNAGTMTIEGDGVLKNTSKSPSAMIVYNGGDLQVSGCVFDGGVWNIYAYPGSETVVTGGKFTKDPGAWLSGCVTYKSADGKYFIVEKRTDVASIGGTMYATLQEALNAVKEGETIEIETATNESVTFDKDFIVVIHSKNLNYGKISGASAIYERWQRQYSTTSTYVILSNSIEDLVDYVTKQGYKDGHGRFLLYDDWTLSSDVRIPVAGATQSVYVEKDSLILDLNGYTLDQEPVENDHGGYPTIVVDYGKKLTIKDSSKDKTGILCGWGWAIDIFDDSENLVTLESGTVTTHGGQNPNYSGHHGRVIRIMGGKFIMNGGAITLAHLIHGNQIFGVITAQTAVASTPQIELNGGYIECAKPEQLWDPDGVNPNCLIGGSKGPDSEVEITGGSFSIVPPKTYFAEGLDAVVDENGHFHIQQVVHEGEEVSIAVSGDGEKLAPTVPDEGSVEIIAPDETKVYVIDIANQEAPAALYTVVTKDAEGEVVSTSNIGVIKVEEKATEKKTIAVAVPFTGATVANLLNTALLNKGDTLCAYIGNKYCSWELGEDKTWKSIDTEKVAATDAKLKRGTAVWVTSAGKVVALGKYNEEDEIVVPTTKETHLLANPTMEAYTPEVKDDETDELVEIGVEKPVRYTKRNGEWTKPGLVEDGGEYIKGPVSGAPTIPVGKGFWFIKK